MNVPKNAPSHSSSAPLADRARHAVSWMVLTLLISQALGAASYSLNGTEIREMPHSANGRDYTLLVGLPSSYSSSPTRRYPVVYVCDGYWDFNLMLALAGNATVDGSIPECIVVGLSYSGSSPDYSRLRAWDLTPGVDAFVGSNSGHASEFLSVIANEFIPFVDREYRTDPGFRILTGSSYAGLFTIYALFERMGLFQGYVAASPSVWWRSREVLATERTYASTHTSLPARLYLTYAGDESASIRDGARQLGTNMRNVGYTNFALAVREIDGERHSSTKAESYNRGLRFVFEPIAPMPVRVINPGYRSRSPLINVSSRARIGAGDDVLIAGFVVEGPEPKRVLIRGVGPGLIAQGVSAALNDPRITLYNASQQQIAVNDNWGEVADLTELSRASSQVGAFSLPQGSRDAAMLATLAPGGYTAVVAGKDGGTGIGLVEVYEVLP
jgi:uncharacterized protein